MGGATRIIVNPASGRGRGARKLPAIRAAFMAAGISDLRVTASAGDESRLARQALDDGCTTVVAAGGDGTWSTVAGVLSGSDCRLALVAAGTGNDFAKSLGVPAADPVEMARLVLAGTERRIDMGRVGSHRFLNIAGFGFDAAVTRAMLAVPWLTGDALYLYASVRQLFGFRGLEIAMTPDDDPAFRNRLLLAICNGRRFGGSFVIAPNADIADGQLDAVAVGDANPLQRAALFAAATTGSHLRHPGVTESRATSFTLRFRAPPAFQADGELCQATDTELEVTCVPRALRVITSAAGASPPTP